MAALTPFSGELDAPALQPFDGTLDGEPRKPRGALREIANQAYAGAVAELPKQVGQAAQYLSSPGRPVYEYGKRMADAATQRGDAPDLQPEPDNHNVVTNALASGARILAPSMVPAAVVGGALALSPFALPAGAALGASALLGALPSALSQGQQTLDKAKAAGVPDEVAIPAARKTAAIEGLGEAAGTYLGGKLLGLGGKAIGSASRTAGKTAAGTALEDATSTAVVKPFLKQLPETVVGEVGTEMGQNAGEAYVEQQAGIDKQAPWDAAKEAIAPTLGMTALLAPFGLAGHTIRAKAMERRTQTLSAADADPQLRTRAAAQIQEQLAAVDPQAAANFGQHAAQAIEGGQPLQVGEHLFAPPVQMPAGDQAGAGVVPDQVPADSPPAPTAVAAPGEPQLTPTAPIANRPLPVIDPNAGPMSRAASMLANADGVIHAPVPPSPEAVAQHEADQKAAAEQDTSTQAITKGPIAEAQMTPQDLHATMTKGDILNGDGKPFADRQAAERRAGMEGAGWAIDTVKDGFVVRRKEDIASRETKEKPSAQAAKTEQGKPRPAAATAADAGATQGARGNNPLGAPAVADAVSQPAGSTQPALTTEVPNEVPQATASKETNAAGTGATRQTGEPAAPAAAPAAAKTGRPAASTIGHEDSAQTDAVANPTAPENQGQQAPGLPVVRKEDALPPVDEAAHAAATSPLNDHPEPTEAQKEAGNYRKGHLNLHGLDISIENPRGSTRSGKRPDGSTWTHEMSDHYGYIRRTVGSDDEQVDVYVGPKPESTKVFVVDQLEQKTGGHDEHKVMLGFDNRMQAMRAYRSNFDKGWRVGPVTAMTTDEFKTWVKSDGTKAPVAQLAPGPTSGAPSSSSVPQGAAQQPPLKAPEQQAQGADRIASSQASPDPTPKGLRVGTMPTNAEPVTIKDGTLFIGKYPALNYDSGEPVKIQAGANGLQIRKALADNKALGAHQKIFGGETKPAIGETPAPQIEPKLAKPDTPPAKPKGGTNLRTAAWEKNPLMSFLAEHGLYHKLGDRKSLKTQFSPDKNPLVPGMKTGPVFRSNGVRDMQELADLAVQDGFLPHGAQHDEMTRLIERAMRGDIIRPLYAEGVIESEMDKRMRAIDDMRDLDDNERDAIPDDLGRSNSSTEDAMRALGFTEAEIQDATANRTGAPQEGSQGRGEPDGAQTAGAGPGAQAGPAEAPAAAEGLTAPTRDDVLAQQERADKAAKADTAEQKRLADKAKADSERGDFKLTGSDRNADGNPDQAPMFARAPAFYSALSKEVGAIPAKAQGNVGWAMNIAGLVKAGKVKQDEVEWSGVVDWLKLQQGKVTRDQIGEFLKANGVQVQETVLGTSGAKPTDAQELAVMRWARANGAEVEYALESIADGDMAAVGDLEAAGVPDDLLEPFRAHSGGAEGMTKYNKYQLPGGTNYREVLLTLPAKATATTPPPADLTELPPGYEVIRDQGQAAGQQYGIVPPGQAHARPWEGRHPTPEAARAAALARINHGFREDHRIKSDEAAAGYRSGHWDQPNVLAHIRVNDRTDANGKKVLFVEEIQSDWAQQGKKQGFAGGAEVTREQYLAAQQAARDALERNDNLGFDTSARALAEVSNDDGWKARWDIQDADVEVIGRYIDLRTRYAAQKNLKLAPRAPFVGRTDAWVSLALKRVIKMAVDEGYDRVAFVNGEQSAERYDLSKQVDEVRAKKNDDGTYRLRLVVEKHGIPRELADSVPPEEVERYVGKDLAAKILAGEGAMVFKGGDLKVGGEGMKAFYDKIVPSVAKDVVRKLGGGELKTERMDFGLPIAPGAANAAMAKLRGDTTAPVTGFTITPAMREHAANGLPMFAQGADREALQRTLERAIAPRTTVAALQQAVREFTGSFLRNSLGRVVATISSEIKSTWEPLIGSVNIESEGKAGEAQAFYDPKTKTVFLIAGHIAKGDEMAVLAHELMHKHGQEVLGKDGWDRLHGVISTWKDAPADSREHAVYTEAADKVAAVGAELSNQELFPYAVQAAINMGVKPNALARQGTVEKWLSLVRQSLRDVWAKITGKPETFGAQDLVNLAFGIAQREDNPGLTIAGAAPAPDSGGAQFARAAAPTLAEVTQTLKTAVQPLGTVNLWDRTVGTQYHKATKDADFKRVFDAYVQQTDDTAHYAIEAESKAPSILMRIDSVKDALKAVVKSGKEQKTDLAQVSKALFANIEGEEGVKSIRYDDDSLRIIFAMTPKQIEMYHQARAAIDTSIERLAQTYAAQMGGEQGMDLARVKDMDLADTVAAVKEFIQSKHDEQRAAQTLAGDVAAEGEDVKTPRAPSKAETGRQIARLDAMEEQTKSLQESGYMPAMRFGKFAVTVKGADDEVQHFEMFETRWEANLAAARLQRQYPAAEVTKGVMNPEQYALFKGVSPETVALFAKFTGADQTEAYQDYIALAKSARSVMKRQLKRKGIAGFSEDATRVMASFITSNARQSAINMNSGEVNDALASKELARKGDVQREAQKLSEYMNNPIEEARRLRGFMFMNFLGGSVASAAVNLTQPILQTAPYLHQFAGAKTAGIMARSAKMAVSGNIDDPELARAVKRAREDGITEPHEIHQLMADAGTTSFGNNLRARAAVKLWGSFFSSSEAFNRRITFIAAYQVGKDAGKPDPYDFARRAVIETQGLYSKANRPNWARGAMGATIFTFKQFSISYIEFLARLPVKQKAIALGILMLAAGSEGLPFADDLEDLIDTIGQSLGYNTNSKKAKRKFLEDTFGQTMGEILNTGVFSQSEVDLSGRLGMGNLLPATAAFKPSETDKAKTIMELAGPIAGILQQFQKALSKAQQGDILGRTGALSEMAPTAVRNFMQGTDMAATGTYKDTRGYKVADVDALESFAKMLGMQPASIALQSRKFSDELQDKSMTTMMESMIADRWAAGVVDKDPEQVASAREALKTWNERNPDSRIGIKSQQILTRAKKMNETRDQRFLKTVPRENRAGAARELQ